ncbi:hypothetical protein [Colwellia ponticola]|uniref:Uncharacterized protein n=1 Tax=Colwellia ponticola TaxID=2304625 RepID=A0A8H2JM26_9GAMM|nr:hypothetical protein [Colwellia ponticola]TMM46330.1 hypothetical protein FCS21_05035 [Colwellia ponticola]
MQLVIGVILLALSIFLFFINSPAIGGFVFFIALGVLRGYRRGKYFHLLGGRSSDGDCCS